MSANDYHFMTHWRVYATVQEVHDVLGDATDLPRWWPSVYLDVQRLKAGGENHLGEEISLYTKGFLPYTLRWDFRVAEVDYPHRIKIEARGDFVGYGIWTFEPDGEWVNITYEWRIGAQKPLLKTLSPIMKPIFRANHEWAMRKGLESLQLELRRRRATTDAELSLIPAPPPATSTSPLPLLVGVAAAGALAIGVLGRRGSK